MFNTFTKNKRIMSKPKLYIKKDKGRYEPYVEPEPPFNNVLYRKYTYGKKTYYTPISMCIGKDLDEGVWVVVKHTYGKSYSTGRYLRDMFMCEKASDIQEVSLAKLGGMDKLADHLCHHLDDIPKDLSKYDKCRAIVGLLFKYENKKET